MKCPKCNYLGFETGGRCKNCGYDFSLLAEFGSEQPARDLPLFKPAPPDDDEPLIKLPRVPRPPLAVRRTPESSKQRGSTKTPTRPRPSEPELQFPETPLRGVAVIEKDRATEKTADSVEMDVSGAGRRSAAAVIDHSILVAIDLTVAYFALRMAGLQMSDWRLLPPAPCAAFLGLIKFAYFWSFTAVGGQTIGKMAMHIYVVPEQGLGGMDATRAFQRTLAGIVSLGTLGLGFVPVLFTSDRRALHDRIAHTRVVQPRFA